MIPETSFTIPDVLSYVDESGQIGTAFRRGDVFVIVATQRPPGTDAARASAVAVELTELAAEAIPAGDTGPYRFPSPPSKLGGLLLTAAVVTAAAGGSAIVARVRARRVRRQWSAGQVATPIGLAPPGIRRLHRRRRPSSAPSTAVSCSAVQLLSINVGIVALAGDFAWRGAAVAAISFVAGLAVHPALATSRARASSVLRRHRGRSCCPRPLGALVGVVALALLGFGVAFALKGLRYLVLKPTLAQLRWSDLLGLAPRTVGVVFAVGGFFVAVGRWTAVPHRAPRWHGRTRPGCSQADRPPGRAVPALLRRRSACRCR